MDRIIEVKVNGNYLTKDNRYAGVQHEANANKLRIEFDEGWDGYAKKVTFWNALGENPVERTLTADLLEDITESTRIYICPIPGEAMDEAGELTFVIDGWVSKEGGIRQRSVEDHLTVRPAGFIERADQPVDPTPTQAEQLQEQIDNLLGDMQEQAVRAEFAASDAAASAQTAANKSREAAASAQNAKTSEANASTSEHAASASAVNAAEGAQASAVSAQAANNAKAAAATSAQNAAISEGNAKSAATSAQASASVARSGAEHVDNLAMEVEQVAYSVGQTAQRVDANVGIANEAAGSATESASDAEAWAIGTRNGVAIGSSDPAYMNNAKYYKEQAQAIAGGNFATEEYVDQKLQGIAGDIDCGTF